MKLATYTAAGAQRLGAVVGDDRIVVDLAAADRALARKEKRKAHPFFTDMLTLLAAGSRGISAAKKAMLCLMPWMKYVFRAFFIAAMACSRDLPYVISLAINGS